MATDEGLAWDEELRAALGPREAREITAPALDERATLRRYGRLRRAARRHLEQTGGHQPEEVQVARFFRETTPPPNAEPRTLSAVRRTLPRSAEVLTGVLVATYGVEEALRAALDALDELGDAADAIPAAPLAADRTLREALVGADAPTKARCRALAEARWPSAAFPLRLALAGWFSDAAWADAVVDSRDPRLAWTRREPALATALHAAFGSVEGARRFREAGGGPAGLLELARSFGDDALPLLLDIHDRGGSAAIYREVGLALRPYAVDEVGERFARSLGRIKSLRPAASAFFARHPALAARHLEPLARRTTRAGREARALLDRAARAAEEPSEEAPFEALPAVLQHPPWRPAPGARPAPRLVVDPPPRRPEAVETVHLGPTDRARVVADSARFEVLSPADTANFLDLLELERRPRAVRFPEPFPDRGRVPPKLAVEVFRESGHLLRPATLRTVEWLLLEGGARVIDGVLRRFDAGISDSEELHVARLALAIESPAVVDTLLPRWLGSPSQGFGQGSSWPIARAWLRRYPDAAALGAIPHAVSATPARAHGEAVIEALVHEGFEAAVRRAVASFEEPVSAAIEALLNPARRGAGPRARPPLPPGCRPEELPRPVLREGRPLTAEALRDLLGLLQCTRPYPPHPGLAEVRQACTPESLGDLATALVESWHGAGQPDGARWMVHAHLHLADEAADRRAQRFLDLPGVPALLAARGTDAALLALLSGTPGGERDRTLEVAALGRGVSVDALVEDLTPTAGIAFSEGMEEHRAILDPSLLTPVFVDERGRRRSGPPGGEDGTPRREGAARERRQRLTRTLSALVEHRLSRLEEAMTTGRVWPPARHARLRAEDPVFQALAPRLLWAARLERKRVRFRLAEDGTAADVRDEPIDVFGADWWLVHPLDLPRRERAAWRELFVAYEILPPFEQLERSVERLAPEERGLLTLTREVDPAPLPEELLARLGASAPPTDPASPTVEATVPLPDGLGELLVGFDGRERVQRVKLKVRWPGDSFSRFGTLPPRLVSEVLRRVLGP